MQHSMAELRKWRPRLRDIPGLDVNCIGRFGWNALHCASSNGSLEVVKLLLAHPAINVNLPTPSGATAFLLACWNGHVSVVQLLLRDPRVDVTLGDNSGCTPLWSASKDGMIDIIEWLIASERDLGDLNQKGILKQKEQAYTTLEIAREGKEGEVVLLLERFIANPLQTRHEVQAKLGLQDALAAGLFAVIIFLCDDLLQLKPALLTTASNLDAAAAAARCFAIARRLPMEVQMILCHRVVGSAKDSVLSKDSEAAFKSLARTLLFPHSK